MKKAIAIVLSFVFLLSSVGITYSIHTCQMANTSQVSLQHKKSCCGNTEMPSGCCENETHTIKLTDSYTQAIIRQLSAQAQYSFDIWASIIDENFFSAKDNSINLSPKPHSPPGQSGVGYHILFRSLLI